MTLKNSKSRMEFLKKPKNGKYPVFNVIDFITWVAKTQTKSIHDETHAMACSLLISHGFHGSWFDCACTEEKEKKGS